MMDGILVNDYQLKKFCYAKTGGINDSQEKKEIPDHLKHSVSLGEYKEDGSPSWAVNLYNFNGYDCRIDLALNHSGLVHPNTLRRVGAIVGDYVFNQLALKRCTAHIRSKNAPSIRISKMFGFQIEGIKRIGFVDPTDDMVVMGLLRDECKWTGDLSHVN